MRLAFVFAVALAGAASALPAGAQNGCVVQHFGTPEAAVDATFCSAPVSAGAVRVTETFAAGGKSVVHQVSIELVPGAAVSRAGDDVDLAPLGIPRALHLQLRFAGGVTRMAGGLLTPGAIPVRPVD